MTAAAAYKQLLSEELPHALHTEQNYRKYVRRIEELLNKKKRSAAEERYLELLSILVERYEDEHDAIEAPDPLAALKELMRAKGISQSQLSRLLGSSGVTSEILSGRRPLSKTHIRKLSSTFNVPADLFI